MDTNEYGVWMAGLCMCLVSFVSDCTVPMDDKVVFPGPIFLKCSLTPYL